MSERGSYRITYSASARRQMNRLPLAAATAMHDHLTGPVADNPHRLGKRLDEPLADLSVHGVVSIALSTRLRTAT